MNNMNMGHHLFTHKIDLVKDCGKKVSFYLHVFLVFVFHCTMYTATSDRPTTAASLLRLLQRLHLQANMLRKTDLE